MEQLSAILWFLLITVLMVGGYFLPTFVAMFRRMPNVGGILVINLLLGWTGVGWTVALVMACVQRVASRQG
jgi:hypothetical protein